ncbi:Ceramide kinase [Melipona quadrifasciata]|uniref:Ceramide kinase n=1 Tax=Melipona quadrifasciata TaxID=166423 RepID=A0A0N0U7C3_9HYME|nr:Ceramide kinase [Melipona quadrifasciata]
MMQEITDQSSRTVLLNTFVVKKKRCRVYFHRGTLIWETEKPPYTRWTLPMTDVLAVRYGDDWIHEVNVKEKQPPTSPTSPTVCPTNFILHYAVPGPKNKWSHHSVTMSHTDPRQVASWVKTIRNYLMGLSHRPRKILLFVNPFGGKKKGLKIWEKDVQPLMTIAGIDTKILVTERAVVCIGGDGTLAEVINGLVLRASRDRQVDPNNPEADLPTPRLPIGVIPSGSTDTVAYSLHGTTDVQTAAIHIIFGDNTGLDISSVHSDRRLLRLYASMLSYGYLGDVIRDSEKFRWMGPQRYDYSGKFQEDRREQRIRGRDSPSVGPLSSSDQHEVYKKLHQMSPAHAQQYSRQGNIQGKFFMVNGANLSCGCSRSPMGFSPHCHVGDGCVDVILVRHTSFFNNIRMLLRLSSKQKTLYDLPFVEVYRAREFTFRALPTLHVQSSNEISNRYLKSSLSVWNCDGEVIDSSNVKISGGTDGDGDGGGGGGGGGGGNCRTVIVTLIIVVVVLPPLLVINNIVAAYSVYRRLVIILVALTYTVNFEQLQVHWFAEHGGRESWQRKSQAPEERNERKKRKKKEGKEKKDSPPHRQTPSFLTFYSRRKALLDNYTTL